MKTLKELLESRRNPDQNQKLSAFERLKKYKGRNDIFVTYTAINKVGINPMNDFNTPTAIYTYPLNQMWKIIEREKSAKAVPYAGNRKYIQVVQSKGKGKFIHDLYTKYTKSMYDKDMDKLRKIYAYKKVDSDPREVFLKSYQTFSDKIDWFESQAKKLKIYKYLDRDNTKSYYSSTFKLLRKMDSAAQEMIEKEIVKNKEFTFGPYGDAILFIKGRVQAVLEVIEDDFIKKNDLDSLETKDNFKKIWVMTNTALGNAIINYAQAGKLQKIHDVEWSIKEGSKNARTDSWGGKMWNITRLIANGHKESGDKASVARWNKILRTDLGYSGMADRSGMGIIHPAEPTQAIFLSKEGLTHVETIENINPPKTTVIKNIDDLLMATKFQPTNPAAGFDLWQLLRYTRVKEGAIKNFKDVPKILNPWLAENYNRMFEKSSRLGREQLITIIARDNLFAKAKPTKRQIISYLYNVESMNTLWIKQMGYKNSLKEVDKAIKNIAKYYKLGPLPKGKRMSGIISWMISGLEEK